MLGYFRLLYFFGLTLIVFAYAFLYGSVRRPMQMIGHFLHLRPAHVFGQRDKYAQVFTFNHPSHLDIYVLYEVLGDYSAIARDMSDTFSPFNFVMNRIGCVLVKSNTRGQNTTQKVLDHLQTSSKPFAIATSPGIVSDNDIPDPLPTIAFRLQQRVQPIVIAYVGCQELPDTLPKCFPFLMNPPSFIQPYVFFLPSVNPSDFGSVEECASHVREQMMKVITFFRSKTRAKQQN